MGSAPHINHIHPALTHINLPPSLTSRPQVAHRDIKPANILFNDPKCEHAKLCDFGFAIVCADRRCRTMCGTPCYMAPELTWSESPGYVGYPVVRLVDVTAM